MTCLSIRRRRSRGFARRRSQQMVGMPFLGDLYMLGDLEVRPTLVSAYKTSKISKMVDLEAEKRTIADSQLTSKGLVL